MLNNSKKIRKILNIKNATQFDALHNQWRNKTLVEAPMITFDGSDPRNLHDVEEYHYYTMKNYTKTEPSPSQPRNILQAYAAHFPHELIPMQGFVIDASFSNPHNPMILLAQPKIVDFKINNRYYLVDTHMWIPINRIAVLDSGGKIQPTVTKTHILDIHQGDFFVFSAGIKPYSSHGKIKYGFDIINVSGCGLPIHDSTLPNGFRLLDDYSLTSHLLSIVNLPLDTAQNIIKSGNKSKIKQLYKNTYIHCSTRPITHYWQFYEN